MTMAQVDRLLILFMLVGASHGQQCQQLSRYDNVVQCNNLGLTDFPRFDGFTSGTYILKGNSFTRVTRSTFPPAPIREIRITQNIKPMRVDSDAFGNFVSSLEVLALGNLHFEYDGVFEPVVGLYSLKHLEISSKLSSLNLSLPFLDKVTMNRLRVLKVIDSGVVDVTPEALDSEFDRLQHLSFRQNNLRHIPDGIQRVMALESRSGKSLELDLSHNRLTTLTREWLPDGCMLTSLDLSHNNIRSIQLHALDNCPKLSKLYLNGNHRLTYLSPDVFPASCPIGVRTDVDLMHTNIRNVEFSLLPCVGRVVFWNTSVPCTCRHKSLVDCLEKGESNSHGERGGGNLHGECVGRAGKPMLLANARQLWKTSGCHSVGMFDTYNPPAIPGAGEPLAGKKDWRDCVIETTTTTPTTTTTTRKTTTKPTTTKKPARTTTTDAIVPTTTKRHHKSKVSSTVKTANKARDHKLDAKISIADITNSKKSGDLKSNEVNKGVLGNQPESEETGLLVDPLRESNRDVEEGVNNEEESELEAPNDVENQMSSSGRSNHRCLSILSSVVMLASAATFSRSDLL